MSRRRPGALALFLLISVAAHGALLLAWRGFPEREAGGVEVLEVTLMTPPRVSQAPDPPAQDVEREVRSKPRRADKPTASSRAAVPIVPGRSVVSDPQPQVLALPPTVGPAEPAFTVSQPAESRSTAPEGKAETSPRQEIARSAAPGPSAGTAGPVTAPSFNAAYLRNPAPRYPPIARRNGEQGTVTLKVLVTREGLTASVSVEATSGSASLDQAAAEAVRSWRFAPARQGAQTVEAWVLVPIVFKLEG